MAINKVIYGGETLIDLTGDTVIASKMLTGITAHDKSGTKITGTCAFDVDSTPATVSEAEILDGEIAFARGQKVVGTMANNGAVNSIISSKDEVVTIPVGYHDGSGTVSLNTTEKSKMIASNIKSGVTILGVEGSYSGEAVTAQSKSVVPGVAAKTVLPDSGFDYMSQVTVEAIPYTETSNTAGGTTVTIAG